jgi:hypothetical protein
MEVVDHALHNQSGLLSRAGTHIDDRLKLPTSLDEDLLVLIDRELQYVLLPLYTIADEMHPMFSLHRISLITMTLV